MKKYITIVESINSAIQKFNKYVDKQFLVPILMIEQLDNKSLFLDIAKTSWDDQRWPNSNKSGVYFIFGYKKEQDNEIGVYVGKASMSSKIGNRLYAHLNPHRKNEYYKMNDSKGCEFFLEFVSSIDLEQTPFFSPALEEYLISELNRSSVYLLNAAGNK